MEFEWPYLGTATAVTRASLPIPISVQCFRVSRQWYGCWRLGFLTYAQMLLQAIAHGGCTDTVSESALEVDSGRKIPCSTGTRTHVISTLRLVFQSDALITELSPPLFDIILLVRRGESGLPFVEKPNTKLTTRRRSYTYCQRGKRV